METLASMEDRALLATTAAMLAQAVALRGGDEEAAELCAVAAAAAAADDLVTQALWRQTAAQAHGRAGRAGEAIALARDAVAILEPTDLLSHRADGMLALADVLCGASRPDEAVETARAALALYERKGNVVGAGRARSLVHDGHGG
jgi:tetratricopeptide (TPR) repeat protein